MVNPYTWNYKNSWIKEYTLNSGFKTPGNAATAPATPATTIVLTGQKSVAAIAVATTGGGATKFPTTINQRPAGDDATVLITETILSQDQSE